MYEQIDFQFRYQAGINSFYAPLFRYLHKKDKKVKATELEFPREQMILWALSAFWYPLACRWLGGFTEGELKQKARNAIYQLQQQINYLATIFGLDPQEFVGAPSGSQLDSSFNRMSKAEEQTAPLASVGASETSLPVASVTLGKESASAAELPEPAPQMLLNTEDDDLLNEVFNN